MTVSFGKSGKCFKAVVFGVSFVLLLGQSGAAFANPHPGPGPNPGMIWPPDGPGPGPMPGPGPGPMPGPGPGPMPGPGPHLMPGPGPGPMVPHPGPMMPDGDMTPTHGPNPFGVFHHSLPRDVFWLSVGGAAFFYHMGKYYRSVDDGYITVAPPIGARVRALPPDCSSYYYNGHYIYDCQGVYYDRAGRDYVVINKPVKQRVIRNTADNVIITADSLNIRRGPGSNYRVIGTLYRGEVVEVEAAEDGWYYVRLSNGSFGWIAQEYARPYRAQSRPKG